MSFSCFHTRRIDLYHDLIIFHKCQFVRFFVWNMIVFTWKHPAFSEHFSGDNQLFSFKNIVFGKNMFYQKKFDQKIFKWVETWWNVGVGRRKKTRIDWNCMRNPILMSKLVNSEYFLSRNFDFEFSIFIVIFFEFSN